VVWQALGIYFGTTTWRATIISSCHRVLHVVLCCKRAFDSAKITTIANRSQNIAPAVDAEGGTPHDRQDAGSFRIYNSAQPVPRR